MVLKCWQGTFNLPLIMYSREKHSIILISVSERVVICGNLKEIADSIALTVSDYVVIMAMGITMTWL